MILRGEETSEDAEDHTFSFYTLSIDSQPQPASALPHSSPFIGALKYDEVNSATKAQELNPPPP